MTGIFLTALLSFILFLLLTIIAAIQNKTKSKGILQGSFGLFIIGYIIVLIITYVWMPAITVPNMLLMNALVAIILGPAMYIGSGAVFDKKTAYKSTPAIVFFITALAIVAVFVVGIFSVNQTYDSISKQEEGEAKPLNEENTPISVAPESARNKVQKSMSVVPNTQFYDLGKLQVQEINGEISYVAPVEFTSFWRYFRGKETEGYFTIPATNINAQPEFIESKMRYTNTSYFHHNIQRKVYGSFPNYIQSGEAQIEVDDEGKPWYVQTIYKPIPLTNRPDLDEVKVAVVDPVTGELEAFDAKEAPDFIEGSISSELATDENEYFGKYVHGLLNSIFGKKDVKIPNESGTENSVTPIFGEQGEMYYFTDMASPKENIDSALGYTLIDARTGELTYYNGAQNNGIMDSKGARQIVNKQFPEKNWTGSMPVLYNVDGSPTWIVNVLDPNGLFKRYAYIKANDSDFAVFGETAKETLNAYRLQLAQDPSNVEGSEGVEATAKNGVVNRVLVTSTESRQAVQFLLKGETTIYTVTVSQEPLSIFLREGDNVQMQVKTRENGTATVEEMVIEGLND
ncbi:DNA-binding protein [Halobacillus amylolyticus]|uniref:DNA-binding protein n=1 Tax=Halobacillus amylolyticus TaxID=2932259 RepID=A0ABY4H9B5_9BACI|nr:DNA-binding protein [Halobacillus amylolyticus]UOR10530.1 DNA-binding protein [Halobacillus amylolyticus]